MSVLEARVSKWGWGNKRANQSRMSGRKTGSLTATPHPLMIRKKGNRKKREASESADMFRVWGGEKKSAPQGN
jgi:hypothetical protein